MKDSKSLKIIFLKRYVIEMISFGLCRLSLLEISNQTYYHCGKSILLLLLNENRWCPFKV